jgi:hypothetical protein
MAPVKKKYALDLQKVLGELDAGNHQFYSKLSEEEKKAYVPLIIMRWMSILGDQNPNKQYAILAVNDLVNIGFWKLSKEHAELQHLLLCLTGLGKKQYRQWISAKGKKSKHKAIDEFFRELHPDVNADELEILVSTHDNDSFKKLLYAAGKSDQQVKLLMEEWKKLVKNG